MTTSCSAPETATATAGPAAECPRCRHLLASHRVYDGVQKCMATAPCPEGKAGCLVRHTCACEVRL